LPEKSRLQEVAMGSGYAGEPVLRWFAGRRWVNHASQMSPVRPGRGILDRRSCVRPASAVGGREGQRSFAVYSWAAGIRSIALSWSVSVVRQLLAAGVLDELHRFVQSVLAGSGLRLLEDHAPERPFACSRRSHSRPE
jgi:hypothetical protein